MYNNHVNGYKNKTSLCNKMKIIIPLGGSNNKDQKLEKYKKQRLNKAIDIYEKDDIIYTSGALNQIFNPTNILHSIICENYILSQNKNIITKRIENTNCTVDEAIEIGKLFENTQDKVLIITNKWHYDRVKYLFDYTFHFYNIKNYEILFVNDKYTEDKKSELEKVENLIKKPYGRWKEWLNQNIIKRNVYKVLLLTSNNYTNCLLVNFLKNQNNIDLIINTEKIYAEYLQNNNFDIVISFGYRFILKKEHINNTSYIINLHISYLPYNRGSDPNLWSFLDNTPKGVTIHYLDEGLDTGDIILQKQIFFNNHNETLSSTYERLIKEIQILFIINWNNIKQKKITRIKQNNEISTFHYSKNKNNFFDKITPHKWDTPITTIIELYEKYKYMKKK